jgi:S1-C subfamily serine protease/antitoxin component YwqK of YwqJK toxin-antitoxin module
MKYFLTLIIFICFSLSLHSQNEIIRKKLYFNKNWEKVEDRSSAYFSKSLKFYDDDLNLRFPVGAVKCYYVKSGRLHSKGMYYTYDQFDDSKSRPDGDFVYYYDNNDNSKWKFISFNKGKKHEKEYEWWENGKLKSETSYDNNKKDGVRLIYSLMGIKSRMETYANDLLNGVIIDYNEDGETPKLISNATNGRLNKWSIKKRFLDSDFMFFRDDFFDNRYNWNFNDIKADKVINSGYLTINTFNEDPDGVMCYPTTLPLENSWVNFEEFVFETRFKIETNNINQQFGLLFGFEGYRTNSSEVRFLKNADGFFYKTIRVRDGRRDDNYENEWQKLENYRQGFNIIQLRQFLNEKEDAFLLELVVNSHAQTPIFLSPVNSGSNFGFSSCGENSLIVDYVEIRYDIPEEESKDIINESTCSGQGTGFAINENGYIATNYHVINNCEEIFVASNKSSKEVEAKVILRDQLNDLAILKIDNYIPEIPYSFANNLKVLENVYAYGYPLTYQLGENIKATNGTISSISAIDDDERYIQHTAPIQPGNSGGPLFNSDGNIIGINTYVHETAENVSISIKSNLLLEHLRELNISIPKNNKLSYILDSSGQYEVIKDYVYRIIVKE